MHAACDLRPRRSPYLVAWQTVLCSLYSLYWPSKAVASFSIRARSHRLLRSCDLAVAIARLRFFCDRSAPIFVFDFFSAVLRNFGQERIYPSMSHASWALGSCLPRTTQAVRSREGTPDQGRKFCWIGGVSYLCRVSNFRRLLDQRR